VTIDALCPVEVSFAVSAGYGGGYGIGYLIFTAIAVSADNFERQTIEVNLQGGFRQLLFSVRC
jgi:hypothetical protein